jgi:hypothetical protein
VLRQQRRAHQLASRRTPGYFDSLQETCLFWHSWDQCCDHQRVDLCVNSFHSDLETIVEAVGVRGLEEANLRRRFSSLMILAPSVLVAKKVGM